MPFYLYILQSKKSGRLYIGQTSNLERRINEHQEGLTFSTRGKGPWVLLFSKSLETRREAMILERQLKSWKNPAKVLDWIKRNLEEQFPDPGRDNE